MKASAQLFSSLFLCMSYNDNQFLLISKMPFITIEGKSVIYATRVITTRAVKLVLCRRKTAYPTRFHIMLPCRTVLPAKQNNPGMQIPPRALTRKPHLQYLLRLLNAPRVAAPPPTRQAMDVRIHWECWQSEHLHHDYARRLMSHPGQRLESLEGPRDLPGMKVANPARQCGDVVASSPARG